DGDARGGFDLDAAGVNAQGRPSGPKVDAVAAQSALERRHAGFQVLDVLFNRHRESPVVEKWLWHLAGAAAATSMSGQRHIIPLSLNGNRQRAHGRDLNASLLLPTDTGFEDDARRLDSCPVRAVGDWRSRAAEMSPSSVCGLRGTCAMRTANGRSASSTAEITAAAAGIGPTSPTPFTPGGLVGDGGCR